MFDREKYFNNLQTQYLGRRLHYFESIDSTNSFIIDKDWKRGAVAVAELQSKGKGRSGKNWTTVPGNACFSFAIAGFDKKFLMPLNIIAGFAVADVLKEYAPVRLKWPNDCVLNGKKICGILLETSFEGEKLEKLAVGVGINLYDANLPVNLDIPITSAETFGVPSGAICREKIIALVLNNVEKYINLLNENSIDIKELWGGYSANLGKNISVTVGGVKQTFIEKGIDENGSLVAENKNGLDIKITSGEVGYDFGN